MGDAENSSRPKPTFAPSCVPAVSPLIDVRNILGPEAEKRLSDVRSPDLTLNSSIERVVSSNSFYFYPKHSKKTKRSEVVRKHKSFDPNTMLSFDANIWSDTALHGQNPFKQPLNGVFGCLDSNMKENATYHPLPLLWSHVSTKGSSVSATTTVRQRYFNNIGRPLDISFFFHLLPLSFVTDFYAHTNTKWAIEPSMFKELKENADKEWNVFSSSLGLLDANEFVDLCIVFTSLLSFRAAQSKTQALKLTFPLSIAQQNSLYTNTNKNKSTYVNVQNTEAQSIPFIQANTNDQIVQSQSNKEFRESESFHEHSITSPTFIDGFYSDVNEINNSVQNSPKTSQQCSQTNFRYLMDSFTPIASSLSQPQPQLTISPSSLTNDKDLLSIIFNTHTPISLQCPEMLRNSNANHSHIEEESQAHAHLPVCVHIELVLPCEIRGVLSPNFPLAQYSTQQMANDITKVTVDLDSPTFFTNTLSVVVITRFLTHSRTFFRTFDFAQSSTDSSLSLQEGVLGMVEVYPDIHMANSVNFGESDVLLVVDITQKENIEKFRSPLMDFVGSLLPHLHVNILGYFVDKFTLLFPTTLQANTTNRERMRTFISRLSEPLRPSTDVLTPLEAELSQSNRTRQLVFFTDRKDSLSTRSSTHLYSRTLFHSSTNSPPKRSNFVPTLLFLCSKLSCRTMFVSIENSSIPFDELNDVETHDLSMHILSVGRNATQQTVAKRLANVMRLLTSPFAAQVSLEWGDYVNANPSRNNNNQSKDESDLRKSRTQKGPLCFPSKTFPLFAGERILVPFIARSIRCGNGNTAFKAYSNLNSLCQLDSNNQSTHSDDLQCFVVSKGTNEQAIQQLCSVFRTTSTEFLCLLVGIIQHSFSGLCEKPLVFMNEIIAKAFLLSFIEKIPIISLTNNRLENVPNTVTFKSNENNKKSLHSTTNEAKTKEDEEKTKEHRRKRKSLRGPVLSFQLNNLSAADATESEKTKQFGKTKGSFSFFDSHNISIQTTDNFTLEESAQIELPSPQISVKKGKPSRMNLVSDPNFKRAQEIFDQFMEKTQSLASSLRKNSDLNERISNRYRRTSYHSFTDQYSLFSTEKESNSDLNDCKDTSWIPDKKTKMSEYDEDTSENILTRSQPAQKMSIITNNSPPQANDSSAKTTRLPSSFINKASIQSSLSPSPPISSNSADSSIYSASSWQTPNSSSPENPRSLSHSHSLLPASSIHGSILLQASSKRAKVSRSSSTTERTHAVTTGWGLDKSAAIFSESSPNTLSIISVGAVENIPRADSPQTFSPSDSNSHSFPKLNSHTRSPTPHTHSSSASTRSRRSNRRVSVASPEIHGETGSSNSSPSLRAHALALHKKHSNLDEPEFDLEDFYAFVSLEESTAMVIALLARELFPNSIQSILGRVDCTKPPSFFVSLSEFVNKLIDKHLLSCLCIHNPDHKKIDCKELQKHILSELSSRSFETLLQENVNSNKLVRFNTSPRFAIRHLFGVHSLAGRKIVQEDFCSVEPYCSLVRGLGDSVDLISCYAVFDGHLGKSAALYSSVQLFHHLMKYLERHPKDIEGGLKNCFSSTEQAYFVHARARNYRSGCAAVVCVLSGNYVFIANAGDSEAVLAFGGNQCQKLTTKHSASDEGEKERVRALGGSVVWAKTWRVDGVLAVSRSIGDAAYPVVVCDPAVSIHEISDEDEFLVIGSDGLFEAFALEKICEIVRKSFVEKENCDAIAEKLVRHAISVGIEDNVSAIVVKFCQH